MEFVSLNSRVMKSVGVNVGSVGLLNIFTDSEQDSNDDKPPLNRDIGYVATKSAEESLDANRPEADLSTGSPRRYLHRQPVTGLRR